MKRPNTTDRPIDKKIINGICLGHRESLHKQINFISLIANEKLRFSFSRTNGGTDKVSNRVASLLIRRTKNVDEYCRNFFLVLFI